MTSMKTQISSTHTRLQNLVGESYTISWEIHVKENICNFHVLLAIRKYFLADLLVFV